MAMYRITLTMENPITGDRTAKIYQFDPDLLTQTKWNNAYPSVKADLDALVASSTPKEPPTW